MHASEHYFLNISCMKSNISCIYEHILCICLKCPACLGAIPKHLLQQVPNSVCKPTLYKEFIQGFFSRTCTAIILFKNFHAQFHSKIMVWSEYINIKHTPPKSKAKKKWHRFATFHFYRWVPRLHHSWLTNQKIWCDFIFNLWEI